MMRVETLDLFDVFVGFTGVEFQTSKEDVEVVRRKVFAVVYVQTTSNFDLLGFMKEVVFRAGKPQSMQARCTDDICIF